MCCAELAAEGVPRSEAELCSKFTAFACTRSVLEPFAEQGLAETIRHGDTIRIFEGDVDPEKLESLHAQDVSRAQVRRGYVVWCRLCRRVCLRVQLGRCRVWADAVVLRPSGGK